MKGARIAIAIAVVGLGGCSGSGAVESSRRAWANTKKSCSAYHYEITDSSFTGASSRTTIAIADDEPVARDFVSSQLTFDGGTTGHVEVASWNETGSTIGTHREGRPAKTMEQLYDDCAHDVLGQDGTKNDIRFTTDARGVLLECWYVPKGCQDDCRTGVVIEAFACGALDRADAGSSDAGSSDAVPPDGDVVDGASCEPDVRLACVVGTPGGGCGDLAQAGVCDAGQATCPVGMIPLAQCGFSGPPPP